jgi:NTP pyrophosphatase (non-canonical NTP hydrolase)
MSASFQERVQVWMQHCFGPKISRDGIERNHRFLEEALELVQACGGSASESHQLVDYVFARQSGEKGQEAGGVLVTLAALCSANDLTMMSMGELELNRVWTKIDLIRAKQAAKPKHSPLPSAGEPVLSNAPPPDVKTQTD